MGCQEPGDLAELRDTVKPYGRHVVVCTGRTDWNEAIGREAGLLGRIVKDVKLAALDMDPGPKVTACGTPPSGDGLDVLIFPDLVRYNGLDEDTWGRVLEEHVKGGRPVDDLSPIDVPGPHFLVCVHANHDDRCGACGPLVRAALEAELERRGLQTAEVHPTSHVGGHRFAGNVIVYPGGNWYGYVRPELVGELLDAEVGEAGAWQAQLRGTALGPS